MSCKEIDTDDAGSLKTFVLDGDDLRKLDALRKRYQFNEPGGLGRALRLCIYEEYSRILQERTIEEPPDEDEVPDAVQSVPAADTGRVTIRSHSTPSREELRERRRQRLLDRRELKQRRSTLPADYQFAKIERGTPLPRYVEDRPMFVASIVAQIGPCSMTDVCEFTGEDARSVNQEGTHSISRIYQQVVGAMFKARELGYISRPAGRASWRVVNGDANALSTASVAHTFRISENEVRDLAEKIGVTKIGSAFVWTKEDVDKLVSLRNGSTPGP